jgi:hypothetical protein
VLVQQLEPCERGFVQTEGEVEALGVVCATSVLDREGVASEPLDGILLRVWEEEVTKSRREGGEAVVVAYCG